MSSRHYASTVTVNVNRNFAAPIGDPHRQFWCGCPSADGGDRSRKNKKPASNRAKMEKLILEADEEMMDKILTAIAQVCRDEGRGVAQ